ncbi:Hypothetical predicted protein [Lecanosticta acicola]|uniref:Heterokaryon incompatibility domain-containing protein n=1 Tax=Lecanosticta acicola TaxID=111012 RepID=A0AAI8Z8T2_9PEZI|nr:Hypothetical predicted protein [Lecanosticta acicola]
MVRGLHDVRGTRPSPANTPYDAAMRKMFDFEFRGVDEELPFHASRLDVLRTFRREAIVTAWAQQMAFESFCDAVASKSESKDAHRLAEKYTKNSTSSPHHHALLSPALRRGPVIKPCPWLATSRTGLQVDMPHYLWDREIDETVFTPELATFVAYTCISHTWGRYTKTPKEYSGVPGVPWKVPTNSKFDVLELGKRLKGLSCETRYVWIDLFCIPQDGSELGRAEIARQAQIFQNAEYVVAWFNDVESFASLREALVIMALQLLQFPPDCQEHRFAVSCQVIAEQKLSNNPTGLLMHWDDRFDSPVGQANPWFTSLWTLQELCLRPDMWICSAGWQMLAIRRDEPMPIIGIVALWNCFEPVFQEMLGPHRKSKGDGGVKPSSSPRSVEGNPRAAFGELAHWMRATALFRLTDMSRADILAIGDRRFCTERRAEAIMSCLGTTKWYFDTPRAEHEATVVMEKYPTEFVAEVQAEDPLTFFGRLDKWDSNLYDSRGLDLDIALKPANRRDTTRPIEFEHIPAQPIGTMLPFSTYGAVAVAAAASFVDTFDCHDTVRNWLVRRDGRVEIPSACILASTLASLGPFQHIGAIFTTITAPDSGGLVDLQAWISARSFECHALVLGSRTYFSDSRVAAMVYQGIILARLTDDLFVKLGSFHARVKSRTKTAMPRTTVTDWIVA